MEIHRSARRHGVGDADIAHAITHHLHVGAAGDDDGPPWRTLYLGPDCAANLLEVIVLDADDGAELVIHAMKMRPRYETLLSDHKG
ncbi:hypothetical protein BH23ACT10_BH23ACT10_37870 [soil metagenome]